MPPDHAMCDPLLTACHAPWRPSTVRGGRPDAIREPPEPSTEIRSVPEARRAPRDTDLSTGRGLGTPPNSGASPCWLSSTSEGRTITGLPVQAPADHVGAGIDADMEDDALARAARARFRSDGIGSIEPDQGMRSALGGDEELLAVRQNASVERLAAGARPESGRLAITTERIFLLDGHAVTLATLEELDDVTLVTDRLLVMLTAAPDSRSRPPSRSCYESNWPLPVPAGRSVRRRRRRVPRPSWPRTPRACKAGRPQIGSALRAF